MDIAENPFITSVEVFSDDDFFNRKDALNEVDKFIYRKFDYNFLFFGQRRIGKTSLLKKIEKNYNTNIFKAVYFTLQGEADTDIDFLINKIAKKIIAKTNFDYSHKIDTISFLENFLPQLKNHLKNKKLILLFDEFDVLGDIESLSHLKKSFSFHKFIPFTLKIIENLKNNDIPLKIIFAIGRNYKDLDNNRFGQITRFGQQFEIGHFNRNTIFNLLAKSDNILPFSYYAKKRIYEISGGHPYFSQCLAHIAFDVAVDNNKEIIESGDIDKSLPKTLKRYSNGVIWIWDTLNAKDKIILYIAAHISEEYKNINTHNIKFFAEKKYLLPACEDLDKTLFRLTNIKFLKKIDFENYLFQIEFFRKWIISEISDEIIQKLFSKIDIKVDNLITNARFYFIEGNFSEAEKLFELIAKYRPENYEILFYYAKSKILQNPETENEYSNIFNIFDKVYKLNPTYKNEEILNFLYDYLNFSKVNHLDYKKITDFIDKIKK